MNPSIKYKSIIAFLVIIIVIGLFLKPRSYKKMESLANSELKYLLENEKIADKLKDFQRVSLSESKDKNALLFAWMYLLKTGDTAIINIEVKKEVYPWQDDECEVYMNSKWGYLFKPDRFFLSVLPLKFKGDSAYLNKCDAYTNNDKYIYNNDSLKLFIPTKKLFSFLKDGYFDVLMRYEDYTIVSFIEQIGSTKIKDKMVPTMAAKIFFNDRHEVLILPYEASPELWKNYNMNR